MTISSGRDATEHLPGTTYLDGASLPAEVDVLIVGSGPAGATFARVISERAPWVSILVVEAGPRLTEIPGRHVRNIADPAERRRAVQMSEGPAATAEQPRHRAHFDTRVAAPLPAPGTFLTDPTAWEQGLPMAAAAMSRNVGGMGSHWATACPPPRGDERAPFIPDAEWDRMIEHARQLLAVNDAPMTDSAEWAQCLTRLRAEFDPRLPDGSGVRNMPVAAQPLGDGTFSWSGADTILGDLALIGHEGFAIAPDTLATRLLIDGRRIVGAEVTSLPGGSEHRVDAHAVVIAGGSLHTPQLLWASGIRPAALGRYLNDHTMVGALVVPDYLDEPDDIAAIFEADRSLNNVTDAPASGMGWIPVSAGVHPIHGQFGQSCIRPAGAERAQGAVMFGFMLAKEARWEDRVRFDDDRTDEYGMPAIAFDYGYTEHDRQLQSYAREQLERIGQALGAASIDITTSADGMSLHYLGSTRMGPADDGASVCDRHSRVWGFDNLYLGGNGVISTALSCNPTLTMVALAVSAAEHLASELLTHHGAPR